MIYIRILFIVLIIYFLSLNDRHRTFAVQKTDSHSDGIDTTLRLGLSAPQSEKKTIHSIIKKNSKGRNIIVKLPTRDKLIKKGGNQTPREYYSIEQKVVRQADKIVKNGEEKSEDKAIQLAYDRIKQRSIIDLRNRKLRKKRISRQREKGYYNKASWVNRRAEGLLEEYDNGIKYRDEALKIADQLYKEKVRSSNEIRAKRKRLQKQKQRNGEKIQ